MRTSEQKKASGKTAIAEKSDKTSSQKKSPAKASAKSDDSKTKTGNKNAGPKGENL